MNQQIIDAIDGDLQNLYLTEQSLKKDLESVQGNIKKLLKARDVLTKDDAPKRAKRTTGSVEKGRPKRTDEVYEYIVTNPDFEISAHEVATALNMSASTANIILNKLREESKVDVVRVGGPTNTTKFYKAALAHATIT